MGLIDPNGKQHLKTSVLGLLCDFIIYMKKFEFLGTDIIPNYK